jgi:hypothetical protein
MNYLNEGKRYYRCRYPNIDEDLIMEKQSLEDYNEFLKNKVNELEKENEILKNKIKNYEK